MESTRHPELPRRPRRIGLFSAALGFLAAMRGGVANPHDRAAAGRERSLRRLSPDAAGRVVPKYRSPGKPGSRLLKPGRGRRRLFASAGPRRANLEAYFTAVERKRGPAAAIKARFRAACGDAYAVAALRRKYGVSYLILSCPSDFAPAVSRALPGGRVA